MRAIVPRIRPRLDRDPEAEATVRPILHFIFSDRIAVLSRPPGGIRPGTGQRPSAPAARAGHPHQRNVLELQEGADRRHRRGDRPAPHQRRGDRAAEAEEGGGAVRSGRIGFGAGRFGRGMSPARRVPGVDRGRGRTVRPGPVPRHGGGRRASEWMHVMSFLFEAPLSPRARGDASRLRPNRRPAWDGTPADGASYGRGRPARNEAMQAGCAVLYRPTENPFIYSTNARCRFSTPHPYPTGRTPLDAH